MSVSDYHIEKGYVFSVGNVEVDGTVIYLPIYMSYLLKEKRIEQIIVDLDIEGLWNHFSIDVRSCGIKNGAAKSAW